MNNSSHIQRIKFTCECGFLIFFADLKKMLPNIGATVSLADKGNSLSAENEKKLIEFAEQLKR